ncbi:MAG TPA: enoyl-CoA hydratase/isomerase family protein [Gaiellaceae bacterium]
MSAELVGVRREGSVALLTLQREEKLNALSGAVERALLDAVAGEAVRTSRCVVLSGTGRAFSAGADINEFVGTDPMSIAAYYADTGDVYERIAALPMPTIAAIHGWCLGGGLELALATDFRVADDTAAFGLPEVELGILPSSGGTHRLVRLLGPARAKELMLLRRRFDAAEAHAYGLVTEVVPAGQALERALAIAAEVADLPPLAVETTKRAADLMPESSREAGMLIERLAYAALAQTDEAKQAVDEFTRRDRRP